MDIIEIEITDSHLPISFHGVFYEKNEHSLPVPFEISFRMSTHIMKEEALRLGLPNGWKMACKCTVFLFFSVKGT